MTCACDREIAVYVLPHQAHRGHDQWTRDDVAVTEPLVLGLCFDCCDETLPAYPKAQHRGSASKVHRYYWQEIWKDTQLEFLKWCRENDFATV
jgi:hypothetical protein